MTHKAAQGFKCMGKLLKNIIQGVGAPVVQLQHQVQCQCFRFSQTKPEQSFEISLLQAFKCGDPNHKSSDCKRASSSHLDSGKQLITEGELKDIGEPVFDEEVNDGIDEDLVYGDTGEALVIPKSQLIPKQEVMEDWLQRNISIPCAPLVGKSAN
jgi:hypothetical protein